MHVRKHQSRILEDLCRKKSLNKFSMLLQEIIIRQMLQNFCEFQKLTKYLMQH